ncbi:MAG: hypothetical protein V1808_04485 [Candidatus Daviesbacteria bacterium]
MEVVPPDKNNMQTEGQTERNVVLSELNPKELIALLRRTCTEELKQDGTGLQGAAQAIIRALEKGDYALAMKSAQLLQTFAKRSASRTTALEKALSHSENPVPLNTKYNKKGENISGPISNEDIIDLDKIAEGSAYFKT